MRNQYKYEARMFKKKQRIEQGSFWVATHELPAPKTLPFYRALDAILSEMDFGNTVRKWSAPYYKQDGPGYPGVDPEVYFKMLMVGIFEGIASERGSDARCADSLGIRAFLGYGITEETPCYATLGNIRRRLSRVEHITDLDTNALIGVRILPGDEGDAEHPSDHLLEAQMRAADAINPEETDLPIETVTGDRGYYSKREVHTLHAEYGIMPNIPDPILNRNIEKLSAEEKESLETAARYTKSEAGRTLQKKRAEFVERRFAHTLESGGMRRTTLRGTENISKRYLIAGFCVNISLLMRKRFGFGTAKQCAAMGKIAVNAALDPLVSMWQSVLFHFCRQFKPTFGFSRHGVWNHITGGLC